MHSIPNFNMYEKYSSINVRESMQMNYGPFTWVSIMKSDPILSSLEQYVLRNFFDLQKVNSKSFSEKTQSGQLPKDLKHIIHLDEESYSSRTLISDIENCSSKEFSRELNNALPLYEITWNLINIFFTNIYPLLPIIDELQFKKDIGRILKREEETSTTKWQIKIEKNTDIAVIGILLILMRLSFSFQYEASPLKCFRGVIDGKIPQWINEEEVLKSYKHIILAKKCLSYFITSRKTTIEVLQLQMVYKFYLRYSPENSGGMDEYDTELSLASIIQLAISLGVNREPTLISNFKDYKDYCHLIRKLWYILIIWDIHETCVSGGFFIIDSSQYDVKFPTFFNDATNIMDINLEKYSVNILELLWLQLFPLKDILMLLVDIRVKSSVEDILVIISEIESSYLYSPLAINSEVDKLGIIPNVALTRSIKTMIYFDIKSCLMCIIYLLFLHCEEAKSKRMCHVFMKKTLSIIIFDLIVNFYGIIFSDSLVSFIVIPSIESSIQRINIILLSFIIRVKYSRSESNITGNEYEKGISSFYFFNILLDCLSLCISLGSLLSSWYCYSLQIVKAHRYLYNLIFGTGFSSNMSVDYFRIDSSQAELYFSLCEDGIKQVKSMLPDILCSNIDIFNGSYLINEEQRVENDILRSALIKYYRANTNFGVIGPDSSHYKGGFRYEFSDTIIPKHWIDMENYPRPLKAFSFSDENFGIRLEFLDHLQNPSGNFDFNFDDIFYNLQNFE
ncbi:unnamed protein product [Debaryomyces fabryi]|nr:unnamed protein product [Debaryomyces fabryi]